MLHPATLTGRLGALGALALLACSQSHVEIGGVGADRRMVELTDAEWNSLCQWIASESPVPGGYYACDGNVMLATGETCAPGHSCTAYYWMAGRCTGAAELYATEEGRARWSAVPRDCPVTVDAWAACVRARAERVCWQAGAEPAECAGVSACTSSTGGDAGNAGADAS